MKKLTLLAACFAGVVIEICLAWMFNNGFEYTVMLIIALMVISLVCMVGARR